MAAAGRRLAPGSGGPPPLLDGEAVEEPGAARAPQALVVAAARCVRRVPRVRLCVVTEALAVVVTEKDRAVGPALRVIAARRVLAAGKSGAVGPRAREDVVLVGRVAAPVHHLALLVQCRLLGEVVAGAVQVRDV